jgi:hypothetical protein
MANRESDGLLFESCQGGKGHAYSEPTVRFYGERSEEFKALAITLQYALPVEALRRFGQ